jgi:hypothetical protein
MEEVAFLDMEDLGTCVLRVVLDEGFSCGDDVTPKLMMVPDGLLVENGDLVDCPLFTAPSFAVDDTCPTVDAKPTADPVAVNVAPSGDVPVETVLANVSALSCCFDLPGVCD